MNNATIIPAFPDNVRSDTYAIDYGRVTGLVVKADELSSLTDEEILERHRSNLRAVRVNRRHGGRRVSGSIAVAREVERRALTV